MDFGLYQPRRSVLALIILLIPLAAPFYVAWHGLWEAGFETLPTIGGLFLISLLLTGAAGLIAGRRANLPETSRLIQLAWGNLGFAVLDGAIFAVEVWQRVQSCNGSRATCDLYPVIWLALAGMHFCYATGCFLIKASPSRRSQR